MISRVLVPMDDSEIAERALRYALEVHSDAKITVLHVVGEPSPMMGKAASIALADDTSNAVQESAGDVFSRAETLAADYDAEIETTVAVGNPARQIIARAEHYDAIVLVSHSGGLVDRLVVGDVAKAVSGRVAIPVTIVR